MLALTLPPRQGGIMTLTGSLRRTAALSGAAFLAASLTAAAPAPPTAGADRTTPIYLDTHYTFAERAADLVSRMTLAEKVRAAAHQQRAGDPAARACSSTRTGARASTASTRWARTRTTAASTGGVHATSFPTNFASTMSWDPALVYQETTAISDEVARLPGQVAVGRRPEQHRPVRRATTAR